MAILKDRMLRAGPIWKRIVRRATGIDNKGFVMAQAVAGAVAGDVAVSKIKAEDHLVMVFAVTAGDLTSEFTITADGVINNAGGTSTATLEVLVVWEAFDD